MKVYALQEVNTGLYYTKYKDIAELSLHTLFFPKKELAEIVLKQPVSLGLTTPYWRTTLSAIEKMYDKPIMEINELTADMIRDTSSLFKFEIVAIEIKKV